MNRRGTAIRAILLGGASLSTPAVALAQTAEPAVTSSPAAASPSAAAEPEPAPEDAKATVSPADASDIVVTGSRLPPNGNAAPTPVTVVGTAEILAAAPRGPADIFALVPQLTGSFTPASQSVQNNTGASGLNSPSLRSIGSNRTLTLLDGHRSVPAIQSGQVDVGSFPTQLISRVEVVTGGASAVYGSDALAGVVNFILDKKFTGIKAEVSGGLTNHGDDGNVSVKVSAGTAFAGGRGHFLISGEITNNEGLLGHSPTKGGPDRSYLANMPGIQLNPAYAAGNGQPQYIYAQNIAPANARIGGIITSGPLRGTAFGPGGTPFPFQYGLVSGNYMFGGDVADSSVTAYETLDPRINTKNIFGRANYEILDGVNAYAEGSFSKTRTESYFCCAPRFGNNVIQATNPFLPASVRAAAAAAGVTQFNAGEFLDVHQGTVVGREVQRYLAGLEGSFQFLGKEWSFDSYYQKGISNITQNFRGIYKTANYLKAIDAVTNPATGAIVCRVTLTNPSDPCVPYNMFGIGVATPASINYLVGSGEPYRKQKLQQDVIAASVSGKPFALWAGDVSVALSFEHRVEAIDGVVDAASAALQWATANQAVTKGRIEVNEGAVELGIPLARDITLIKSLDLSLAARATNYSTSGYVTTWKVGSTWIPIDGVRFRATLSRDIRAPNLQDLFTPGISNLGLISDPSRGNASTPVQQTTTGNLALKPEKADTFGGGVVVQPAFLPGFSASVDYYVIKVKQAINSLAAQDLVNQCAAGVTTFCSSIVRDSSGAIVQVLTQPFNFAQEKYRGVDFEMNYRLPLRIPGAMSLRLVGTRFLEATIDNGVTAAINHAGENNGPVATGGTVGSSSVPKWKGTASLTYLNDPLSIVLTARAVSKGTVSNAYIVCSSNCPATSADFPTINYNKIAGAAYFDAAFAYDFDFGGFKPQLFLTVKNLANKDPAVVPAQGGAAQGARPINPTLYDFLGRTYQMGVRVKL